MTIVNIEAQFLAAFDSAPTACSQASGRVNLLGEHIDYNGGVVLPTTIDKTIDVALGHGAADADEIFSVAFQEKIVRTVGDTPRKHWSDYVCGALNKARSLGFIEGSVKIAIDNTLPPGAGVSSSAAVIIATLRASAQLKKSELDRVELAVAAQDVENRFIGMPCGIMDQMAISVGESNHAVALDTHTLDFRLLELPSDVHFAVLHSGIHRKLDDGRYGLRRHECELAAHEIGVSFLCRMTEAEFASVDRLADVLKRRARHAYTEHKRVQRAVIALDQGDMSEFGRLMDESHQSMRLDFEVSTPDIDDLVQGARRHGALGARLTGGGFGGCIVACVPTALLSEWKTAMAAEFRDSEYVS